MEKTVMWNRSIPKAIIPISPPLPKAKKSLSNSPGNCSSGQGLTKCHFLHFQDKEVSNFEGFNSEVNFKLQGQVVRRTISTNPGLITMTTHMFCLTVNPGLVLIRL